MSDYYDAGSKPVVSSGSRGPGIVGWINAALSGAQSLYQVWAQKRQWQREDTAVQRRAADLQAAGINPLLAAGSAAQSSAPINVSVPQVSYEAARDRSQIGVSRAQRDLIEQQANRAYWDRQSAFSSAQSAAARAQADMQFAWPLAQAELEKRKLENAQTGYMLDWFSSHGLPFGTQNSPAGEGAILSDYIRAIIERLRQSPHRVIDPETFTEGSK